MLREIAGVALIGALTTVSDAPIANTEQASASVQDISVTIARPVSYSFDVLESPGSVEIDFFDLGRSFTVIPALYTEAVARLTQEDKELIWDKNKLVYDVLNEADRDNNGCIDLSEIGYITFSKKAQNKLIRIVNSYSPGRLDEIE